MFVGYNPHDPPSDPAWIVIIAHARGISTWYAHMQPRRPDGVYQGARVAAGQVIGYAGNTGRSTGVHLHWVVEVNGTPVDPRRYT